MWQRILRRLYPSLQKLPGIYRIIGTMSVTGTLYGLPFAVAALILLVAVTDWAQIGGLVGIGLVIFGIGLILIRFRFFIQFKLGDPGLPLNFAGSLDSTLIWGAALVYGPSVLWVSVAWSLLTLGIGLWRGRRIRGMIRTGYLWGLAQNFVFAAGMGVLSPLIGLLIYRTLGGTFPTRGFGGDTLAPEFIATLLQAAIGTAITLPWLLYVTIGDVLSLRGWQSRRRISLLILAAFVQQALTDVFAILLAGLYVGYGAAVGAFGISALIIVSILSHISSDATQRSRQRSLELEQLERMERAMIASPPDGSRLRDVLAEYVPGLFSTQVEVRLFPDPPIAMSSMYMFEPAGEALWTFAAAISEPIIGRIGRPAAWSDPPLQRATLIVPVIDGSANWTIGAVIVMLPPTTQRSIQELLPVTQALADEIASLAGAANYRQAIQRQQQAQELEVGGRIQSGFLPTHLPQIAGWGLAATLQPARETSGDFYDVIDLGKGCYGLCVADVSDKGVGAALYMALTRTLIRTYAAEFAGSPAQVFAGVNRRILADTSAGLFVTAFYAVLDTITMRLTYASAGHNPPYLFDTTQQIRPLAKTGIPLGMFEEAQWNEATITIQPGERLLAYTDGVTDAEAADGTMYGDARLRYLLRETAALSPEATLERIVQELTQFMAGTHQFDDITLMLLSHHRDASASPGSI
jgi:serine phosphatase RsbU (regulator of sigma subunit)